MMGLAGNRPTDSAGRVATIAGGVVVVASLAASASWLAWTAVKPLPQSARQAAEAKPVEARASVSERLLRIPDVAMISAGPTWSAPSTGGAFTLFAARADADGGGAAIISVNGAPQASFSVGDEIAPGIRLARVGADWIEIDAGGETSVVGFSNTRAPAAGGADMRLADITGRLVNSLPTRATDGGYRITSQAELSMLAGSGLQAGDVVLKVDGAPVSSGAIAQHAARLQAGGSVEIVYERNGQIATARIGSHAQ